MEKTKKWNGTWPANCDLCGKNLRPFVYFVDGRIKNSGHWALLCPLCHVVHGTGLGTGQGQMYSCETLMKLGG
jgi:hypothetical protein